MTLRMSLDRILRYTSEVTDWALLPRSFAVKVVEDAMDGDHIKTKLGAARAVTEVEVGYGSV